MKQHQQKRQGCRLSSSNSSSSCSVLVSSQKSSIMAIILVVIAMISTTTTTTTKFVYAQLNIDGFPEACSDSLDQVLDCFRRNTQCAECAPGSGLTGFLDNFQPPLPPIDPTAAGGGETEDADTRRRNLVQQLRSTSSLPARHLQDEEGDDETSSSVPSDMPSMVPSDMPSLAPSQATDSAGTVTLSPDGTVPCTYVEDPLCPVVTCCFECFGASIELYKCWLYFNWELSEAALTAITQCPFLYDGSDTCPSNDAGGENGGGEDLFDIP